jgi:cation diffusion facilitator CzcD-associated flavoprotein CzcO
VSSNGKKNLRIAIVGAGVGGIATAVKLKKAGFHDFTVFESSAGAGGTWYDNTYPGCEVDVPSHAYSFSFMPYDWSRTHARQPELKQYIEDTLDRFDIRGNFRFSTKVEEAMWDGDRRAYMLSLSNGEKRDFEVLVAALGMHNVPNYPDWPGLDDFERPKFHTARWEHEHDLKGKRVAVVGTGSSGVQIVPELAEIVERLYVFQREPGWLIPKGERDFTSEEREEFRTNPRLVASNRMKIFRDWKPIAAAFDVTTPEHQTLTKQSLDYLEETIDAMELRKLLTPQYEWGCKRLLFATTFYPALNNPKVEVVPKAVRSVTRTGVVDVNGVEREIDVLVLATGFKQADFLVNLPVVGPNGEALRDYWSGQPESFLGITVAGYPNFFMIYGPNTNGGGSIIAQIERQAEVLVSTVKRMRRGSYTLCDTKKEDQDEFVRWVDAANRKLLSAVYAGCNTYYYSPSGRNVTQWPTSHKHYQQMTRTWSRTALVLQR